MFFFLFSFTICDLKKIKKMKYKTSINICIQIAKACEYLEDQKLVHRFEKSLYFIFKLENFFVSYYTLGTIINLEF